METIRELAPDLPSGEAYSLAAATGMEHLGNLFKFLDQRIGELVMFDPDAKVKEATIREALKVGEKVCSLFVQDGKGQGIDSAVMRDAWVQIVEMAVIRSR